jgi:hypothetical protein
MLAALYARRSEETCLESVDTAIECAGSEELKVYLTRYWRSYTETGLIGFGTQSLYFARLSQLMLWNHGTPS